MLLDAWHQRKTSHALASSSMDPIHQAREEVLKGFQTGQSGTQKRMKVHLGKVMGMGTHRGLWVWVQVGMGVGTGFGYPYPYPYPHGGYSGANSPF